MKNWFWIPLAAITGVIAGSWGPREDLESYKETVRAERSQKKVAGTAGFDAFARLANIPDVAKRRPKSRTNELARSVRHLAPVESSVTTIAFVVPPTGTECLTLRANSFVLAFGRRFATSGMLASRAKASKPAVPETFFCVPSARIDAL